jgi:TetR/AcrR family transcriptional regulator
VTIEAYERHKTMVAQGRASGDFRGDFDPRLLYIAIIGLAEIFVTARPVLELLYGGKLPDLRREYKDFVTNLIVRGIQGHVDTGRAPSRRMGRRP